MIAPSSISKAARAFRKHLAINLGLQEDRILIGHPASTSSIIDTSDSLQYLNLFFYHFLHSGYPTDAKKDEPIYIRLYCLVTAYGNNEEKPLEENSNKISAGEMDLRLLGNVIDIVHKGPLLEVADDLGKTVAQLQIVPVQITLDDMNKIWSTQMNTSYRPSAAFELALLPIPIVPLEERIHKAPRVADTQIEVFHYTKPKYSPDWEPYICFVDSNGEAQHILVYEENDMPEKIKIAGAGADEVELDLICQRWEKGQGWDECKLENNTLHVNGSNIDPQKVESWKEFELPEKTPGQFLLYAEREWDRKGQPTVVLKSNILLITIYSKEQP